MFLYNEGLNFSGEIPFTKEEKVLEKSHVVLIYNCKYDVLLVRCFVI